MPLYGSGLMALIASVQATAAGQQEACEPWSVAAAERCSYVQQHAAVCYPGGGFQEYLRVHYCVFGPSREWLSLLLLLTAAVLAFGVLLTVSERFFCPALELISDYLKLPPAVAGATLLSFGNGAPDTFTQVAAVGQKGGAAVGMALSEPLGGGMFASNVVFGLVVLVASRQQVTIQRWAFLKDVGFYLAALLLIAVLLADGKATMHEAALMCGLYVVYVAATFYTSRADEPVHANVELHEVPPQDGGIDAPDSESIVYEGDSEPLEMIHATTSISGFEDLEAPPSEAGHSCNSSSPADSDPYYVHTAAATTTPPRRRRSSNDALGSDVIRSSSRTLQALLSWRQRGVHGLREPLMVKIDEGQDAAPEGQQQEQEHQEQQHTPNNTEWEANSSGDTIVGSAAIAAAAAAAAARVAAGGIDSSPAEPLPDPVFSRGCEDFSSPSLHRSLSSEQQRRSPPQAARHCNSLSDGLRIIVQGHSCNVTSPRASQDQQSLRSPRASGRSTPVSPSGYRCPSCNSGVTAGGGLFLHMPTSPLSPLLGGAAGVAVAGSAAGSEQLDEALTPHVKQLQQQHLAEQADLLEQQAAEHVALLAAHEEEEQLKAQGMSLKHKLQLPFVHVLSCTMPRVGTGSGHHYQRWRACLLPFTAPLLLLLSDPALLLSVGWAGLLFGAACAATGSCIIWTTYPSSNVPRKTLKGVFAVMAFVQAIVWLNISAAGLVQVCVMFGVIFGISPALLGATVLAWGNSVPDLINNLAMAKDGFPSMAVAACFASPLFTLLIGMGGALGYGTVLHGGTLTVPVDGPLMVMAGFAVVNMCQHLIVVPLVHRYKMCASLAVTTFLFYVCFNIVYGLTMAGVIKVDGWPR